MQCVPRFDFIKIRQPLASLAPHVAVLRATSGATEPDRKPNTGVLRGITGKKPLRTRIGGTPALWRRG